MPSIDLVCEVAGLPPIQPATATSDIAAKNARSGVLPSSGAPSTEAAQSGFAGPELVTTLKESGVSDHTIWLDPEDHHLFGILTRSDAHTLDTLPDTEIKKRWWAVLCDIMQSGPDNAPVQVPLKRVFFLP